METALINFHNVISSDLYEVKVVALSSALDWKWYSNSSINIGFYDIYRNVGDLNVIFTLQNIGKIWKTLKRIILFNQPTVVLSTHTFLNIIFPIIHRIDRSIICAYWPQNKLNYTEKTAGILAKANLRRLFKIRYYSTLIGLADIAFCISSEIKYQIEFLSNTKCKLLFHPIETHTYDLYSYPKQLRLLFIGRLDSRKNVRELLNSLGTLHNLEWRLDIIGDGPLKSELMALSRKLKIENRINWFGYLKEPFGLREKYSALVLTSQAEGFPMVVMQSLLRGLPIICPQKLSVYDDVVMEGINGYGYDESKSNNLMESIRKLKMLNKFSPNEIRADTLKRFGSKSYIQRFNNSINLLNHNSLK